MVRLCSFATALLCLTLTGCSAPKAPPGYAAAIEQPMDLSDGRIELDPDSSWKSVVFPGATAIPASKAIEVYGDLRLTLRKQKTKRDESLDLQLSFQSGTALQDKQDVGGSDLTIRIPLSSSNPEYGESRSCVALPNGHVGFTYNAGLDEKNFFPFAAMTHDGKFSFLVNKYLCRALAASFPCNGRKGSPLLPRDMGQWKLWSASLTLRADPASGARARVPHLYLDRQGSPFDYATCERIAPSSGLCCVAKRETQWHCGVKPDGQGWHKVSGDCWHRETGSSCKD